MATQDSSLRGFKNDELVILTIKGMLAGLLFDDHGELIEPATEQAKAADAVSDAAIQELL